MSWLGDQGPEQFYAVPKDQPGGLGRIHQREDRPVRSGSVAPKPKDRKLVIRLELVPASSGTAREDGNWPRLAELHGQPAGVELSFVDIADSPAGQQYRAAWVVLNFLPGGGQEMAALHNTWQSALQMTPPNDKEASSLNRREFISAGGAALIGTALGGCRQNRPRNPHLRRLRRGSSTSEADADAKLRDYRPLGFCQAIENGKLGPETAIRPRQFERRTRPGPVRLGPRFPQF